MGFLKKLGAFGGTLVGGAIGVIDVLDGGLIDSYDADDIAMDSYVEVHDVKPHEVSEYYRFDGTPVEGYELISLA